MTASQRSTSSAGVPTALAPATALAFSGVRFHTATSWPTSIKRAAMAAPILPIPATPIRMKFPPGTLSAGTISDDGALRKRLARAPGGCDSDAGAAIRDGQAYGFGE